MPPKSKRKKTATRKPGAQTGNRNAQKHGFYSKQFEPEETKRLSETDRHSIEDEIDLIRVCIDRLSKQLDFDPVYMKDKDGHDLDLRDDHYLKQLNTLGLMTQNLATLERTHYLTRGKGSSVEQGIMEALEELRIELGI